jgi:predicted nucleotidyltransferase
MIYLDDIKQILKENQMIFEKYGVEIEGLFGSYVHGRQKENSDLDILISPNGSKPFGIFALIRLENELNDLLGLKVDIAVKRSLKPAIGKYILKELVPL